MVLSVLISAKTNNRFKIPNREVMTDWARWVIGDEGSPENLLRICVEGPVNNFATLWPDFMQQQLDPKLVGKAPGATSRKTPERIYHAMFWGLMQSFRGEGGEVSLERRAGAGYIDVCLRHKRKHMGVLIELKSSNNQGDMERDVNKALDQIVEKNYRNRFGLENIHILREYGIASYHLNSRAKGRYLELVDNQWVERDDPMMNRNTNSNF